MFGGGSRWFKALSGRLVRAMMSSCATIGGLKGGMIARGSAKESGTKLPHSKER